MTVWLRVVCEPHCTCKSYMRHIFLMKLNYIRQPLHFIYLFIYFPEWPLVNSIQYRNVCSWLAVRQADVLFRLYIKTLCIRKKQTKKHLVQFSKTV